LTLLLATPAQAHCFSIWHYPWAQQCGVFHVKQVAALPSPGRGQRTWPVPPERIEDEIPLPNLMDAEWGGTADERLQGIAKLRALSDAE
jgi:hypothetical protein